MEAAAIQTTETSSMSREQSVAPKPSWGRVRKVLFSMVAAFAVLIGSAAIYYFGWLKPSVGQAGVVGGFDFPGETTQPPRLQIGEKLTFGGYAGMFSAGTAVLTVEGTGMRAGREGFRVVKTIKTSKAISTLYSVNDSLTSWVDVKDGRSLGYLLDQDESNRKLLEDVKLDYTKKEMQVHRVRTKNGEAKPWDYTEAFPEGVEALQDAVSVFYQLRMLDLEKGESTEFSTVINRKFYGHVPMGPTYSLAMTTLSK